MNNVETLLRSLDPATEVDSHSPEARALLERIVATEPDAPVAPLRRRHPVRWAFALGIVAAVLVGFLAFPTTIGQDKAVADWTPVPTELPPVQEADTAKECTDLIDFDGPDMEAFAPYEGRLRSAKTVAEQRGIWKAVLIVTPDLVIDCLGPGRFEGVSMTTRNPLHHRGPRAVELFGFCACKMPTDTSGTTDKKVSTISGYVGTDIAGLSYASREHGEVVASVADEHFILFMPGDEFEGREELPVTLTYRDGTTGSHTFNVGWP